MSLLLLLLLSAGTGRAQDPALAPSTPADWRSLYVQLRQLQERVGGPIALAAAGPEARDFARRATRLGGGEDVVLRQVSPLADPQAELALSQQITGMRCVAWLQRGGAGGFELSARGDCSPGAAQVEQAGGPPTLLRLVPKSGDLPYVLVDEAGKRVDTWRFASLSRDDELRDRLVDERRSRRLGARVLELGGATLLAGAVVPLALSFSEEGSRAEDRLATAGFMALSGGFLVVGARFDRRGLDARQAEPGRYVRQDDALDAVDQWNQRALQARQPAPPPAAEPAPPPPAEPAPPPAAAPESAGEAP